MTRLQEIFIENLRRERKARGFTQEKLAEKCGITANHLAGIEGGRRFPSPEVFQRFSDALGLEPFQLLVDPRSIEMAKDALILEKFTEFLKAKMDDGLKEFKKSQKKNEESLVTRQVAAGVSYKGKRIKIDK